MKDPQLWIFIAGAFAAIATGAITIITADKKTKVVAALVCLSAIAQATVLGIDYFSDKSRGPHLRLHDTPTRVEQVENGIKIHTKIVLLNDGDRPAINALPVTASYLNGELISTSANDYMVTIDAGEPVYMPLVVEVGNDVWDGNSKLTLTLVVPYDDETIPMPPLKKKWEFNPNADNDLSPVWAVVQWDVN